MPGGSPEVLLRDGDRVLRVYQIRVKGLWDPNREKVVSSVLAALGGHMKIRQQPERRGDAEIAVAIPGGRVRGLPTTALFLAAVHTPSSVDTPQWFEVARQLRPGLGGDISFRLAPVDYFENFGGQALA